MKYIDKTICSICYEPLKFGVNKFNCTHKFHDECIRFWNKNCPNCRALPFLIDWQLDTDFFNNIVWDNDPRFINLFRMFPIFNVWFQNCYINCHQLFFGEVRCLNNEICMTCMTCQKYNHLIKLN